MMMEHKLANETLPTIGTRYRRLYEDRMANLIIRG